MSYTPSNANKDLLPPQALKRLEALKNSHTSSSLLSSSAHLSTKLCGFTPVGEVMGCIVQNIGFSGYAGCGWYGGSYGYGTPNLYTTLYDGNNTGNWGGLNPYLSALHNGYNTALARMEAEAAALGADGVIGVTLKESRFEGGQREYVAMGTAIRSLGGLHTTSPFTTLLSGNDLAKLVSSGWIPKSILFAISLGVKHDDYYTRMISSSLTYNSEMPAHTDLVNAVRNDARLQLARMATRAGAHGVILSDKITTEIHEIEIAEQHRDLVGMANATGNAIVRYDAALEAKNFGSIRKTISLR
jgi:uncharacterized protein YbjQ (UPF0145 family)